MDTKEIDTDKIFEQLRESLKNLSDNKPETTKSLLSIDDNHSYTNDTIISLSQQVNDHLNKIDLSSTLNYNNATISVNPSVFTAGTGINSPWATATNNISSKIELDGNDSDIIIKGKSLSKTIEALEERLNMLVPNPELENEWDQLKELGDQYRALEAKLKEQGEMWAKLKAMPPPEPLY